MARQIEIKYIDFCTDGNAARAFAPEPRKKVQLPKAKKRVRYVLRLDPLATLGIVVAVFMVVLMGIGILELRAEQNRQAQMASYVDTLTQENAALRAEFNETCDLQQVKELALALGMIPKEEAPQTGISMYVPEQVTEKPTIWEKIGTFLASLFA